MKICFNLSRVLIFGIRIPLTYRVFGLIVVCIDLRYELLPRFCFHYGLLAYDTRVYMNVSGLNVSFDGKHANFGD